VDFEDALFVADGAAYSMRGSCRELDLGACDGLCCGSDDGATHNGEIALAKGVGAANKDASRRNRRIGSPQS